DKNIYDLPPEELAHIPTAPGSLDEALNALKSDKDFLLKGGVFTQDVIDTWTEYKIKNEINPVKLRPHPHEFMLYFDI
ncbi:MAG: glutamine synthetase, partial [Desulfobacterales bacterium]|nr:glutamine synthetase [Desulfobacterales bacterium]